VPLSLPRDNNMSTGAARPGYACPLRGQDQHINILALICVLTLQATGVSGWLPFTIVRVLEGFGTLAVARDCVHFVAPYNEEGARLRSTVVPLARVAPPKTSGKRLETNSY
jgi:hypothetical protein